MKKISLWLLSLCSLFSTMAFSLTLEQAKQQGLVGETLSGYLAPVKQNRKTQVLVEQINLARSKKYQQLAENNAVSIDEVARMAGLKLIERANHGEYVRGINGQWMKK